METLPVEIKNKILDEIPQFTRLNKTCVAGRNHLIELSKMSIRREEFICYINNFEPDLFCIFEYVNSVFRVYAIYKKGKLYKITGCYIDVLTREIVSEEEEYIDNFTILDVVNLVKRMKGNLHYDVVTTCNIYHNFRIECKDYKKILYDRFAVIPKILIKNPHISIIGKALITFAYVDCNISINCYSFEYLIEMIDRLHFDDNGIFNGDQDHLAQLIKYINCNHPINLKKIIDYLK